MILIPDMKMGPFCRTQWVSPKAKHVWEPRVAKAASAYYRLELETVKAGIRKCTTRHVSPDRLDSQLKEFAKEGLVWLPRVRVGAYSGFANAHPAVIDGKPWNWYGPVAASIEHALAFVEAEERGDHDTIGQLLGFPPCCRKLFSTVWMAGYVDPVWQSACETKTAKLAGERHLTLAGDDLWLSWYGTRYNGTRLTPHLACSFNCKGTLENARNWWEQGQKQRVRGLRELKALLSLPTRWDALHGVTQVTTPIFRLVTNSVACAEQHIIDKQGPFIPKEAATGLTFPFNQRV